MTVGARSLVATYIKKYTVLELYWIAVCGTMQMVTRFRPGTPPQNAPDIPCMRATTINCIIRLIHSRSTLKPLRALRIHPDVSAQFANMHASAAPHTPSKMRGSPSCMGKGRSLYFPSRVATLLQHAATKTDRLMQYKAQNRIKILRGAAPP